MGRMLQATAGISQGRVSPIYHLLRHPVGLLGDARYRCLHLGVGLLCLRFDLSPPWTDHFPSGPRISCLVLSQIFLQELSDLMEFIPQPFRKLLCLFNLIDFRNESFSASTEHGPRAATRKRHR